MEPDPLPDAGQPVWLSLVADIYVDLNAWHTAGDDLDTLCQKMALATFDRVQKLQPFDVPSVDTAELALRLTTDKELENLNLQFRGLAKPTNVLSFAALDGDGLALLDGSPLFLGDIAIAAETVIAEAHNQNKPIRDHLAHMVVHGTLHLLGYDHEEDGDALEMETLEIEILKVENIGNPYQSQVSSR